MKQNFLSVLFVGATVVVSAGIGLAHHSQSAEFDRTQTVEFTGTVKAIEWTNPHGYVQVEVEGADGVLSIYKVEISAPNGLYRNGWRRDSVKPGTVVTFMGSPSRDPESTHVSGQMSLPDGTVAFRGSGPARN